MPGPLNGVRVLDLTGVVSGPFATMFLADQGADVLKIEPIGGDITRRSRATIDKDGEFSALFISSNRGKRSLSIDVKSTAGREVLARLVAQADVLVQNFRPGTMERLGLGVEGLRQRQSAPDLRLDQRRRRYRPVREEARLRSDHSGPVRLCRHPVPAGHQPSSDDPHHRL